MTGAQESEFFPGPCRKYNIPSAVEFASLFCQSHRLSDLHHGRDTGGIVVGSEMNLRLFIAPREGIAIRPCPQMINVCADDDDLTCVHPLKWDQ